MEFDYYEAFDKNEWILERTPEGSKQFVCGHCDIRWRSLGFKSNCWCCGREVVLLSIQ